MRIEKIEKLLKEFDQKSNILIQNQKNIVLLYPPTEIYESQEEQIMNIIFQKDETSYLDYVKIKNFICYQFYYENNQKIGTIFMHTFDLDQKEEQIILIKKENKSNKNMEIRTKSIEEINITKKIGQPLSNKDFVKENVVQILLEELHLINILQKEIELEQLKNKQIQLKPIK